MTGTSAGLGEAVRRDAAVLLEEFRAGRWAPCLWERDLASALARARWDGHVVRPALREVLPAAREGRLIAVLAPAVNVVDDSPAAPDVILQLRVLIDALAT